MAKKILIVEDDKDIRRLLKNLLESEGYEVQSAENGQVALDLLQIPNELPDLIILDLMMPVMDGFQFHEELKKTHLVSIPVVVMTADGRLDEQKTRVGAIAAVRKPVDIDALLNLVSQYAATKAQ